MGSDRIQWEEIRIKVPPETKIQAQNAAKNLETTMSHMFRPVIKMHLDSLDPIYKEDPSDQS